MRYIDLGLSDYRDAYILQMKLVQDVASGVTENTLIITEHESVITIGRKGSEDSILKSQDFLMSLGVEVLNIDRGGDATCHMPGQIVAYPIFKLEGEAKDIHKFLEYLEEAGIHFLDQYGISGMRRPGLRGVWIGEEKIGSIGIGIKKWVTYHGLAININNDLSLFSYIRPCGIPSVKITSLQKVLNRQIDIEDAKYRLKESFEKISFMAEAASQS